MLIFAHIWDSPFALHVAGPCGPVRWRCWPSGAGTCPCAPQAEVLPLGYTSLTSGGQRTVCQAVGPSKALQGVPCLTELAVGQADTEVGACELGDWVS